MEYTESEVNGRIVTEKRRVKLLLEKIDDMMLELKATRRTLMFWEQFKKDNFPKGGKNGKVR